MGDQESPNGAAASQEDKVSGGALPTGKAARLAWVRDLNAQGALVERQSTLMTVPRIVKLLKQKGVLTTVELATELGVAHRSLHTWSQGDARSDQLERAGVKRMRNPEDRRSNIWLMADTLVTEENTEVEKLDLSDFAETPAEEVLEGTFGEPVSEEDPAEQPFPPQSPWAMLRPSGG